MVVSGGSTETAPAPLALKLVTTNASSRVVGSDTVFDPPSPAAVACNPIVSPPALMDTAPMPTPFTVVTPE
jgi:hypothetical protein